MGNYVPQVGDRVRLVTNDTYDGKRGRILKVGTLWQNPVAVRLDGDEHRTNFAYSECRFLCKTFTDYVPQVGELVRVSATARIPGFGDNGPISFFAGMVGTVMSVAPNLTNCRVAFDAVPETVLFFPGDVAPAGQFIRSPLSYTEYKDGMPVQAEHINCKCVLPDQPSTEAFALTFNVSDTTAADALSEAVAGWEAAQDQRQAETPDYYCGYADGFRFRTALTGDAARERIAQAIEGTSLDYRAGFRAGFARYQIDLSDAADAALTA